MGVIDGLDFLYTYKTAIFCYVNFEKVIMCLKRTKEGIISTIMQKNNFKNIEEFIGYGVLCRVIL